MQKLKRMQTHMTIIPYLEQLVHNLLLAQFEQQLFLDHATACPIDALKQQLKIPKNREQLWYAALHILEKMQVISLQEGVIYPGILHPTITLTKNKYNFVDFEENISKIHPLFKDYACHLRKITSLICSPIAQITDIEQAVTAMHHLFYVLEEYFCTIVQFTVKKLLLHNRKVKIGYLSDATHCKDSLLMQHFRNDENVIIHYPICANSRLSGEVVQALQQQPAMDIIILQDCVSEIELLSQIQNLCTKEVMILINTRLRRSSIEFLLCALQEPTYGSLDFKKKSLLTFKNQLSNIDFLDYHNFTIDAVNPHLQTRAFFIATRTRHNCCVNHITDAYTPYIEQPEKGIVSLAEPVNQLDKTADNKLAIEKVVRLVLSQVLKLQPEEFEAEIPFAEYGLDSIQNTNVIVQINQKWGLALHRTLLFQYPTLTKLVDYLATHYTTKIALHSPQKKPIEPDLDRTPAEYTQSQIGNVLTNNAPLSLDLTHFDLEQDIAVIGLAGRFPGATDIGQFWQNLSTDGKAIADIPYERWHFFQFCRQAGMVTAPTTLKKGGFLKDIDLFDANFFHISPVEAMHMDPQQRILLEEAWHAFEDAGYSYQVLSHTMCGVFIGAGKSDYHVLTTKQGLNAHAMLGTNTAILAARISYHFNLVGPALSVDTACSSSLVAIHQACQSLRANECALALAGGTAIMSTPIAYSMMHAMGILSKQGQCLPFDNDADGMVPGEAVGLVVLKRLADALADKDSLYGVIKASGVNQDGRSNGITAPNANSQTALQQAVYTKYHLNPRHITYVEAHGTATKLGDPIEIIALTESFHRFTDDKQFCAIGAVKATIGHTLEASGVVGLIKVLLCLHYKQYLSNSYFKQANPAIDFSNTPFYISQKGPWLQVGNLPRMAALNAFGFSGTNCHLVVSEAPSGDRSASYITQQTGYYLITLSAKSHHARLNYLKALLPFLQKNKNTISLDQLSYTLNARRNHFKYRCALIIKDITTLCAYIQDLIDSNVKEHLRYDGNVYYDLLLDNHLERVYETLKRHPHQFHEMAVLVTLARCYVAGSDIAWDKLYVKRQAGLMLPGYPFDRDAYWYKAASAPLMPALRFVEKHAYKQDSKGYYCTVLMDFDEYFIADHQVLKRKTLPGVVYCELVIAAMLSIKESTSIALNNSVLLHPLNETDFSSKIPLEIFLDKSLKNFEIRSLFDGKPVLHAKGEIAFDPPHGMVTSSRSNIAPSTAPLFEIEEILQRCQKTIDKESVYRALRTNGIEHGSYYQVIDYLYRNDNECMVKLSLKEACDRYSYYLHPALLDAAIQPVVLWGESHTVMVPYSIDRLTFYKSTPHALYSYIVRNQHKYDVYLLEEQGTLLVSLEGIYFRSLKINTKNWFYRSCWVATNLHKQNEQVSLSEKGSPTNVLLCVAKEGQPLQHALIANDTNHACYCGEINEALLTAIQQGSYKDFSFDTIYFLSDPNNFTDIASVREVSESQERTTLALFRLIKALQYSKRDRAALCMVIVSYDVCPVFPNRPINPYGAGLLGLTHVIGKEYPHWKVVMLDVATQEVNANASWIIQLIMDYVKQADTAGAAVALRQGRFYRSAIQPIVLPDTGQTKFRQQGNYVIIGGAGGIGFVMSQYLATRYAACTIWIGRSNMDATIINKIKRIETLGGKVVYIQADITNLNWLQEAVISIKKQFKNIHGVIHSGLVLADGSLYTMDMSQFKAALSVKVAGSVALYHVFQKESLDFMLFFSSMQSLVGNAGQSNYAAGSTFQDAYGLTLAATAKYPVYTINWGYWGSVGAVATTQYKARISSLGMLSIDPHEGAHAVEQIIASSQPQVFALKAKEHVLQKLNLIGPLDFTSLSVNARMQQLESVIAAQRNRLQAFKGFAEITNYCYQFLIYFLLRNDVLSSSNKQFDFEMIRNNLKIKKKYEPLLRVLLDNLVERGYVGVTDTYQYYCTEVAEAILGMQADFVQNQADAIKMAHPVCAPYSRLLERCFQHYSAILSGTIEAIEVLFPNGSLELVSGIYQDNALADGYNVIMATYIKEYIQAHLTHCPNQRIDLLEIGAGVGATTKIVLEAIKPFAEQIRYNYTDISLRFVHHGRKMFADQYPFMEFRTLNIDQSPMDQGFTKQAFAIIIATNVLHATSRIVQTIRYVQSLLKPHGVILVNEIVAHHIFPTITFGLTDGWWVATDPQKRIVGSPLLSEQQWLEAFQEAGLTDVQSISFKEKDIIQTAIFIAQNQ